MQSVGHCCLRSVTAVIDHWSCCPLSQRIFTTPPIGAVIPNIFHLLTDVYIFSLHAVCWLLQLLIATSVDHCSCLVTAASCFCQLILPPVAATVSWHFCWLVAAAVINHYSLLLLPVSSALHCCFCQLLLSVFHSCDWLLLVVTAVIGHCW